MSASKPSGERAPRKRFDIQWVCLKSKHYGGCDCIEANDLAEARQTFIARYPYKKPVYIIERGLL